MELESKLQILADSAKYDASCASGGSTRSSEPGGLGDVRPMGICHSYTPDGRCVSLLRILLTNYCIYDCLYCVNRISSDVPRARFTVREVVDLTLAFYRRNYIEGLFLSSGIFGSPDATMEQLVAVARTLREEHRFRGYIHLKVIPGASPELLAEAGRHADRLSANIELPTATELTTLAPEKNRGSIESTMAVIDAEREAHAETPARFAPAGQTTQMIVGAGDSSDADILLTSNQLYARHRLKRVYYSAFSPIPHADARLPFERPPLVREHRLYQADWLVRRYGFSIDELTTAEEPNLDLTRDPKLVWALRHRELFPIDVNAAPRELLLRIPGLGYRNVDRILDIRRVHRLATADLVRLRVAWNRMKAFVIVADHHPAVRVLDGAALAQTAAPAARQLALFDAEQSAHSGQL
ncbi:MAG: putative DNA modification/repair radical SAM protein [Acidobacteria bacterium]|nr:putative DNA modification/repair radical SAM protein [Acidobacteriota bacterium]